MSSWRIGSWRQNSWRTGSWRTSIVKQIKRIIRRVKMPEKFLVYPRFKLGKHND